MYERRKEGNRTTVEYVQIIKQSRQTSRKIKEEEADIEEEIQQN